MSIQEHLDKIRNAVYGREVRESIAKGIETAYDDASENGNANMEVKMARGTNPNLNARLNKMEETDRQTTAQLAQTDNQLAILDIKKTNKSDIKDISDRVDQIITTPSELINEQEIIDARQGKTSLGENLSSIKGNIGAIEKT